MLSRMLSQQCILSHPAVPKGVLTICTRWEAEKERETQAEREAERDWMYSPPHFTSLWHPEASPKLLVKKQAAVWWIKQQQQPLPSLPSKLLALIFQSLSAPALCLFYSLPGKFIFSYGPPLSPSVNPFPPPPPSLTPSSTTLSNTLSMSTICSRIPSPKIDFQRSLLCSLLWSWLKVNNAFAIVITASPVDRRKDRLSVT